MTKLTITREQLEEWVAQFDEDGGCDATDRQLEALIRQSLAAMGRESITVTDDMAYAFHHALTDSMIGADDVEEIKTGLRAVFANLTAPVVNAEYPDRLPCSVLLEPGLRFGKGIKTSTMLAALARRAVYESDMAALSSEERAEFQARIEDFKALIAQPAPVVPEEKPIPNTLSMYAVDEVAAIAEVKGWNACRAAMLQASPVCTCPSGDGSLRWPCPVHPGSSPVIPDGYVMVPMRLTAENGAKGALSGEFSETKFVNCPECFGDDECETCDGSGRIEITVPVTWTTIKEIWAKGVEHFAAAPQSPGGDHATVPGKWIPVSERLPEDSGRYWCYVEEQNDLGKSHYQWNCSWNGDRWWVESEGGGIVTHWMPLPAAPQEVNRE